MANIQQEQSGSFIATTQVWDVNEIYKTPDLSKGLTELLVRLYQNLNKMAINVNLKDTGYYNTLQFVNGQKYFPNPLQASATPTSSALPNFRQVYRKVIYWGKPLPNATEDMVAHGITCNKSTTFTRIYACASDTTGFNYIPLPYASPILVNNIELRVDATYVYIRTGSNRTNFDITYVVLEYLQQ